MEIYINLPACVEDLDDLVHRLEAFSVSVSVVRDCIALNGLPEKLLIAQNYALRFIGPESIQLINVIPDCYALLGVSGLVSHFERVFEIVVSIKGPQIILLKGRKKDNDRFRTFINDIEVACSHSAKSIMTPFKLSNLRLLCQKFSINFDELPPNSASQTALLSHLSSLLDPVADKHNSNYAAPSYLEVYRMKSITPSFFSYSDDKPDDSKNVSTNLRSPSTDLVNPPMKFSGQLRSVVIDGSNVAFAHGNQMQFSPRGILLALNFFLERGHTKVVAVVPRYRHAKGGKLFDQLERSSYLSYSSSRNVKNEQQAADDDRIILQLAVSCDAVVVSNDQFRNYRDENEEFKEVIDHRLLQYTLALDTFLIPEDPHGANGPSLSECLCITTDPKS